MSQDPEATLARLVQSLRPVVPLRPPWQRALVWLATAGLMGLMSCALGHNESLGVPGKGNLWHWAAVLSAATTAIAAALALFAVSVPGHTPAWWFVPVLPMVCWMVAGVGTWAAPAAAQIPAWGAAASEVVQCLGYLVGMSAVLMALAIWMLRRGWALRPFATAALGGLASAAAACAMLGVAHPHAGTMLDLAGHLGAVFAAVTVGASLGRLLPDVGEIPPPR
ncbi:NrsF family protein [Ideonella sp. YS5]|uniref:NrsF family protein n=1 Tax=Ideonella sp. YS5 TaxID=3453714 RepID=UPI003EEE23BD